VMFLFFCSIISFCGFPTIFFQFHSVLVFNLWIIYEITNVFQFHPLWFIYLSNLVLILLIAIYLVRVHFLKFFFSNFILSFFFYQILYPFFFFALFFFCIYKFF
jgi:hypothetical protein